LLHLAVLGQQEQFYYTEYHKMSKPTIQIHNIETGEIIEREMNASEIKKYNEGIEKADNMKAEAETRAAQRQVILDKLGLTADEAKLLIG